MVGTDECVDRSSTLFASWKHQRGVEAHLCFTATLHIGLLFAPEH